MKHRKSTVINQYAVNTSTKNDIPISKLDGKSPSFGIIDLSESD